LFSSQTFCFLTYNHFLCWNASRKIAFDLISSSRLQPIFTSLFTEFSSNLFAIGSVSCDLFPSFVSNLLIVIKSSISYKVSFQASSLFASSFCFFLRSVVSVQDSQVRFLLFCKDSSLFTSLLFLRKSLQSLLLRNYVFFFCLSSSTGSLGPITFSFIFYKVSLRVVSVFRDHNSHSANLETRLSRRFAPRRRR